MRLTVLDDNFEALTIYGRSESRLLIFLSALDVAHFFEELGAHLLCNHAFCIHTLTRVESRLCEMLTQIVLQVYHVLMSVFLEISLCDRY